MVDIAARWDSWVCVRDRYSFCCWICRFSAFVSCLCRSFAVFDWAGIDATIFMHKKSLEDRHEKSRQMDHPSSAFFLLLNTDHDFFKRNLSEVF